MNNRDLGRQGEKIAREFLTLQGYQIIAENFWSKYGEIDLIAEEDDQLSFIEVKLARDGTSISAKENITVQKRKRLKRTARYYLLKHGSSKNCRFDIVAISGLREENRQIELIKNAFLIKN